MSVTLQPTECTRDTRPKRLKLAYLMSRFPKITETFVLYEILELARRGLEVDVFPLLRERQAVVHPEAMEVVERAHYQPFVSPGIVAANMTEAIRAPSRYIATMAELLRGTWGNTNFFLGALAYLPKAVRFARQMRTARTTHVHAHFANHPALVALAVHRLTGIPFSFTAHGSDIHVRQQFLEAKIAAAAFVVTISDYNKRFMVEHCGGRYGDKIHVIRCGVDPDVFQPLAEFGSQETLRMVCVASYEEVKGHRYLIAACEQLRSQGCNFVCDLVGNGPLQAEVEGSIAAAGLQDQVRMHGVLERADVAMIVRDADVAVLPSVLTRRGDREGIPVVLMEAMASGLPVVASRLSGIPELVLDGRTGWLVEPGDSASLAAALHNASQDAAARREMGAAGRQYVLEKFNLRRNTATLIDLFEQRAGRDPAT